MYDCLCYLQPSLTDTEIAVVKEASVAAEKAAAERVGVGTADTPRLVGTRSRQHLGRFLGLRSFPLLSLPPQRHSTGAEASSSSAGSFSNTSGVATVHRSLDWCAWRLLSVGALSLGVPHLESIEAEAVALQLQ